MYFNVLPTKEALGSAAAKVIAEKLNAAIARRGYARMVLSTGASQFDTLKALVKENVDWSRVTCFHLDEYVALPETHVASFRKYLKERFVAYVPNLKEFVFVNGEGDVQENIALLTRRLREDTIDVGVIGVGENAHIAFNDPPADFNTREAYLIVNLDDRCKQQQVGEGWFPTVADVPKQAVSMSPYQIMQCDTIVSPVPYAVKAEAVRKVLLSDQVDNMVPASLLKTHRDFYLFADADSAAGCSEELLKKYQA